MMKGPKSHLRNHSIFKLRHFAKEFIILLRDPKFAVDTTDFFYCRRVRPVSSVTTDSRDLSSRAIQNLKTRCTNKYDLNFDTFFTGMKGNTSINEL